MPRKLAPSAKRTAVKKSVAKKPKGIAFVAQVIDCLTKQPLARAKVSVFVNGKRTASDTKLTNSEGKAKLTVVPGNTYRVSATKAQYGESVVETKVLSDGVVAHLSLIPEDRNAIKLRANITIYFYVYHCSTLAPIQGATCTMKTLPSGTTYTQVTGSDGMATFSVPANKSYELKAQKSGYTTYTYANVALSTYDDERQFDFPLCPN